MHLGGGEYIVNIKTVRNVTEMFDLNAFDFLRITVCLSRAISNKLTYMYSNKLYL